MNLELSKYLTDIIIAIEDIESFVLRNGRQYEIFLNDKMFRMAVEREIGIIGEALNQALKILFIIYNLMHLPLCQLC